MRLLQAGRFRSVGSCQLTCHSVHCRFNNRYCPPELTTATPPPELTTDMSLLEKPNILSLFILAGIVLVAGAYGVVTYTNAPDLEHYAVDPEYEWGFNFDRPQVVKLPKKLKEISGLAGWKSDGQLLAVQDEDGLFFVVDAKQGTIIEEFKFGKDRDYEGIARKGDEVYVLEGDGDFHHITFVAGQTEYEANKIETDFTSRNDTEGICYDSETNSLLIVPKEDQFDTSDKNDYQRAIYSYDLETQLMSTTPAFYIDQFAVGQAVYGKNRPFLMKPSGIAVDPITKDIYVIASVGNILVVIDRENDIKHIEMLREKIFRQPEGICFDTEGNLYISSEGRGKKGVIASLPRKQLKKMGDE